MVELWLIGVSVGTVAAIENAELFSFSGESSLPIAIFPKAVTQRFAPRKIVGGGSVACCQPPEDLVRIPKIRDFESPESYYATMFHELGHVIGHETGLNRAGVTGQVMFGSCDYIREELIAELASAFVCAEVGIDDSILDNTASYSHRWLHALQGDPRDVISASAHGQRAADYIRGGDPNSAPTEMEVAAPWHLSNGRLRLMIGAWPSSRYRTMTCLT